MFADPIIKRLASIEDWLEVTLWCAQGRPEGSTPLGALGFESKALRDAKAAKNRTEEVPVDVAAEMARRRRAKRAKAPQPGAAAGTKTGGLQRIRDELAERRRAAKAQ